MQWLSGKKTYILVILGTVSVLIHWLSGDTTFLQFISSEEFTKLIELLGLGTIRLGVSKALTPKE